MSTSVVPKLTPVAVSVAMGEQQFSVGLADGRVITVPLEWFPSLRDASNSQLANWRLIGGGVGIRWEDLDEDLSVKGLLTG